MGLHFDALDTRAARRLGLFVDVSAAASPVAWGCCGEEEGIGAARFRTVLAGMFE
jgi:hypothetical protein